MNVLRACAWMAESTHASPPVSRFARLVATAKSAAAAWLMAIRQQYLLAESYQILTIRPFNYQIYTPVSLWGLTAYLRCFHISKMQISK